MNCKNPSRKQSPRLSTPVRLGVAAVAACFLSAPALSNPLNPTVVNGATSFNQAGKVLTVTNSPGAIINWQKFSIQAGETTHFAQTAASSTVLNRVLNDPTAIYGTLSSNGRVWLVNPAGIMVGPGGKVDVAAFVASTLNISNADFLAGRNVFINDGSAGNVINQGEIRTPAGGSVYLIGSNVTNEGIITTPKGETILAAGNTVSLIDSATPGVKVDITGTAGNATNLGTLTAEAGRIGIAGVIVRNSGLVNASSVVSEGGRIFLRATKEVRLDPASIIRADAGQNGKGGNVLVWGDETTEVDGSISARGGSASGDGGFVETSAHKLSIAATVRITTEAPHGKAGTWLLDPYDFTIGSGGDITGAVLSLALDSSDVTIQTDLGSASCTDASCGPGTSSGNGDIFVNDSIVWNSGFDLKLFAYRNIEITQPITASGVSHILLRADNTGIGTGTVNFSGSGQASANGLLDLYYNPASYVVPTDYSSKLGPPGNYNTWMLVNTLGNAGDETAGTHGLQAMARNLSGKYALGRGIDASATSGWNSSAGFVPVGNASINFTGYFDGLGHTITGLTINRPGTNNVGLFGFANGAIIRNAGLNAATITGNSYVGSLAGLMDGSISNISNSHSSNAAISGAGFVGGLVGWIRGNISHSYSTGTATGTGATGGLSGSNQFGQSSVSYSYSSMNVSGNAAGGLVGGNDGTISNSYSTGVVTGNYAGGVVGQNHAGTILDSYSTGAVNGTAMAGGLVGYAGPNDGFVTTIVNSYSTGAVSGSGSVGGLVGVNQNGTVTGSFWDTDTSGQSTSAGGAGKTTAEMTLAATFTAAGWSAVNWDLAGGSYPALKNMPAPTGCVGFDNCWTGAIDSFWATPGNWTAGLPGGSQTVKIDVAGTPTISLIGVNPSFGSLWLAENLDVDAGVSFALGNLFTLSAGTATFNGDATVHSYAQTGGALAGSGAFSVTNNFVKTGGAIDRFGDLSISQAAGILNFSATQVGSALTLAADSINLGPVGFAGGVNLTTDNLTISGAVSSANMSIQPKTYNATTLGRVTANNLSLLQSDLDNLTTGYIYIYGNNLTIDSGSTTPVTFANVSHYLYAAVDQLAVNSPLTLSQSGTALYLNPSMMDINATLTVGAGGVFLGRNASGVAYLVGVGAKTYPGYTVELTNAELNRIVTTGPVTIGDPYNAHSVGHGPMQIVGPIDLSGITTQLRLVGNGITQAAGATITVPQLAADGYGSISLPEANQVGTFAAKSTSGGVSFTSVGPLTIGKVETLASPANFATTGVTANGSHPVIVTAGGPLTISAAAGQQTAVFGSEIWLNFNGDLSLNAGAGGQAYVEAALPSTIHLDFANSAGVVRFNGVIATAPTNGLPGPGTPDFIGFWDSDSAAIPGINLQLTNSSFSFGGASCIGYDNCWTGIVDSLWATVGNWTAGHAPTGSESAKVDVAGNPTITLGGVNPSFGSLWLAENLDVDAAVNFTLGNLFTLSAGTATFNGPANVYGYAQTGGKLAGSGVFTVTNNFAQTGGTIDRVGNMTLNQAAGALNFAATRVGNLVFNANAINLGPVSADGSIWAEAGGDLSVNGPLSSANSSVHLFAGLAYGGGALTVNNAITAATNVELDNKSGNIAQTAGTIQVGTATTSQTYNVRVVNDYATAADDASISLNSITIDPAANWKKVLVASRGAILDNNGPAGNISTSGEIILTSSYGGNPGGLAISADIAGLPTSISASVNGGTYGGVRLNKLGDLPGTPLDVDTFGDLSITATGNFDTTGLSLLTDPANLLLVAGGSLTVTTDLWSPGMTQLAASNMLTITSDGVVQGGTVLLTAPTVHNNGWVWSQGNIQVNANDYISNGGEIRALDFAADVDAVIGNDMTLYGAEIVAGHDIKLTFQGPTSTLSLNTGSRIEAEAPDTIYLNFLGRSSGGILIDGMEAGTADFGTIFFNAGVPASLNDRLFILYTGTGGSTYIDPCALSPDLCAPPVPIESPMPDVVKLPEADPCTTAPDSAQCKALKMEDEKEKQENDNFGKDDGDRKEKSGKRKLAQCGI